MSPIDAELARRIIRSVTTDRSVEVLAEAPSAKRFVTDHDAAAVYILRHELRWSELRSPGSDLTDLALQAVHRGADRAAVERAVLQGIRPVVRRAAGAIRTYWYKGSEAAYLVAEGEE